MSRFSTINSKHSAALELERQRLEKKMGQLQREVEGARPTAVVGAERRFLPPRRPKPQVATTAACTSGRATPQPSPELSAGGCAPSVEMAWLLRANSRMEEQALEVQAFLARHELDRYATLLAESEEGIGNSLDALSLADHESLAKAGLPPTACSQLLEAIAQEEDLRVAPPSEPAESRDSRPSSGGSGFPGVKVTSEPRARGAAPHWRGLHRAPPGWARTKIGEDGRRRYVGQVRIATLVDAAIGDITDALTEANQVTEAPSETTTGNGGASSRPSTSSTAIVGTPAGPEKVCCYQCFRQVYTSRAVCVDDEATTRPFCSDACADQFRQVLARRTERQRELGALRGAVFGGQSGGCAAAAAATAATTTTIIHLHTYSSKLKRAGMQKGLGQRSSSSSPQQ